MLKNMLHSDPYHWTFRQYILAGSLHQTDLCEVVAHNPSIFTSKRSCILPKVRLLVSNPHFRFFFVISARPTLHPLNPENARVHRHHRRTSASIHLDLRIPAVTQHQRCKKYRLTISDLPSKPKQHHLVIDICPFTSMATTYSPHAHLQPSHTGDLWLGILWEASSVWSICSPAGKRQVILSCHLWNPGTLDSRSSRRFGGSATYRWFPHPTHHWPTFRSVWT